MLSVVHIYSDNTTYSVFMSLTLDMWDLPGGYAGGRQRWTPQSGPAGGSSPMKRMQLTQFNGHSD